jgi:hypothetical protein
VRTALPTTSPSPPSLTQALTEHFARLHHPPHPRATARALPTSPAVPLHRCHRRHSSRCAQPCRAARRPLVGVLPPAKSFQRRPARLRSGAPPRPRRCAVRSPAIALACRSLTSPVDLGDAGDRSPIGTLHHKRERADYLGRLRGVQERVLDALTDAQVAVVALRTRARGRRSSRRRRFRGSTSGFTTYTRMPRRCRCPRCITTATNICGPARRPARTRMVHSAGRAWRASCLGRSGGGGGTSGGTSARGATSAFRARAACASTRTRTLGKKARLSSSAILRHMN